MVRMRSIVVRAAQQGRVMYDWIIEADIYRYRKELAGLEDGPQRYHLLHRLKEAEASLARRQLNELVRESSHA
jgi:predicted metallo-beta-lactamase superfamily hydrolase